MHTWLMILPCAVVHRCLSLSLEEIRVCGCCGARPAKLVTYHAFLMAQERLLAACLAAPSCSADITCLHKGWVRSAVCVLLLHHHKLAENFGCG